MIDAPIALAFTGGLVAAFNPCGFAMLPAYLSWFVGGDHRDDDTAPAPRRLLRAVVVGASVSLGFTLVFGLAGLAIVEFSLGIQEYLPWVTVAIGLALIPLGIAMLRGFELKLSVPRLNRGTDGRSPASMFVFGVSYAVVSLSCTLPVFLATVASTFRSSTFASGLAVFGAYTAGMASVLMVLTVALALARSGIVGRMRGMLRHVNTASGALLTLAGVYVAYYGWFEIQIERGNLDPTWTVFGVTVDLAWPAEFVSALSGDVSSFLDGVGPTRAALLSFGLLLGAWVVVSALRLAGPAGGGESSDAVDDRPLEGSQS